jgi:hypothetical protein
VSDLLKAGATVAEPNTISASVDVVCPAGKVIDIHATAAGNNCHITVPAQANLGGIELHNSGSVEAMDLLATLDTTGITYQVHGSECPSAPNTELTSNGAYRGVTTFKGSGAAGMTVH